MERQYNIPGINDASSTRTKALGKLHEEVSACNKCGTRLRISNSKLKQGFALCWKCGNRNTWEPFK